MKIVFVNGKSGRSKKRGQLDRLRQLLERVPDMKVHIIEHGVDLRALVRQAVEDGAEMIGAAGGDGTINAVAGGLVGTDIPLAVIPFGTLNHFARDAGVPENIEKAVALLAEGGTTRSIDVGQINGRIFLNNSSIGIYPYLVRQRERNEGKMGKWPAYGVALASLLLHPNAPRQYIRATIDGKEVVPPEKVGLVFVANNICDLGLPRPGRRNCFDGNVLDVYTLQMTTRFDMVRAAVSYLTSKDIDSPLVDHYTTKELTITLPPAAVRVACDGEVFHTTTPLRYRSRAAALKVWVPIESLQKKEEEAQPNKETAIPPR